MLATALNFLIQSLLEPQDMVVFMGDYVDRGPDSRGVFELLHQFRNLHGADNVVFLRGNHEDMLLTARFDPEEESLWLFNGGWETLASYGIIHSPEWFSQLPEADRDLIASTQLEFPAGRYHFVHAGIPPEGFEPMQRDPRLWIRDEFIDSEQDFGAIVVFGHTIIPTLQPLVMGNKIGIDTGAFLPEGKLTMAAFDPEAEIDGMPEFTYYQINHHNKIEAFRLRKPKPKRSLLRKAKHEEALKVDEQPKAEETPIVEEHPQADVDLMSEEQSQPDELQQDGSHVEAPSEDVDAN
ncbi:MAG: Calcineurin-like phosphoesterase [Capsulimonas sp.]|nr:Calcineurin-like phosphoesterase [Capsulimonas sp.]